MTTTLVRLRSVLDRLLCSAGEEVSQGSPGGGSGGSSGADSAGGSPAGSASGSPGGAAPQSPGSSAPSGDTSEGVGTLNDDWAQLFGEQSNEPEPTVVTPPAAAQSAQPTPPPVQAQPAPSAAEVQPPPPTPVAPTPGPQDTHSPRLDPADLGGLARALSQPENERAAIEHLSTTMFKLSDEELEAIETNAREAIPRLLSRVFVKAHQSLMQSLSVAVPQIVTRVGKVEQTHKANESRFYERWHELDPAKHGEMVSKFARAYRVAHPEATLDDAINFVGPMVYASLGLTHVPKPSPAPAAGSPVSGAPGVRPPIVTPFAPAPPGAAGAVTNSGQAGPYDYLGQ